MSRIKIIIDPTAPEHLQQAERERQEQLAQFKEDLSNAFALGDIPSDAFAEAMRILLNISMKFGQHCLIKQQIDDTKSNHWGMIVIDESGTPLPYQIVSSSNRYSASFDGIPLSERSFKKLEPATEAIYKHIQNNQQ